MSLLKANSIQIGQSNTATNNFTLSVPSSPDGTIKLARGNSGATTSDILTINSNGSISLNNGGAIVLGTAVNAATGSPTSIDFTGIPSWAKRVSLLFNGLSTNGSSAPRIRLGTSEGFITSGYLGSCLGITNTAFSNVSFSAGFDINDGATSAATRFGIFTFICMDTNNNWVLSGSQSQGNTTATSLINGIISLSGTLTQIKITTVNGTDTFDAGSVNIMYEG
jgi:hypothetical protein